MMNQFHARSGLLNVARERSWRFSATLAIGWSVFGLLIYPALATQSVVLFSVHPIILTLACILAGAFATLASVRYREAKTNTRERERTQAQAATRKARATTGPTASVNGLCDAEGRIPPLTLARTVPADRLRERTPAEEPLEWTLEVLGQLDWKHYEELCVGFYRARRIRAETITPTQTGVVSLRLYQSRNHVARCTAVVRCRAWGDRRVDLAAVQEVHTLMIQEKVEKGYLMSQGNYTNEARRFAEANHIALINDRLFLAMLLRLPERDRRPLLKATTTGDWSTPTCPQCGTKMIIQDYLSGSYWGCANYPTCTQTLPKRRAA